MPTDKQIIDKAVDWRLANRPSDTAYIRVNLTPQALHLALRFPKPAGGKPWPQSVFYRGYRVEATQSGPPQRLPGSIHYPFVPERLPYHDSDD